MAKNQMSCIPSKMTTKSNLLAIAALNPNANGKPLSLSQTLDRVVNHYITTNSLSLAVTPAPQPRAKKAKAETETETEAASVAA